MRDHQTTPFGNSVTRALLTAEKREQATWPREAVTPYRQWLGDPRNEDPPAADPPAPVIDWESDDNPFKGRFAETQAAFTRGQQELAELRKVGEDPQAYLELGKKQGWIEYETPGSTPPEEEGVDPDVAALRQELAEHRQWRQGVDAERQQESIAAGRELFHTDLDTWAEKDNVNLSKADHNAIFGLLMQAPDPTQESAARQVYEAHVADKKAEREAIEAEIREQMKRPRIPTPPTGGQAATGTKPFHEMTRAERDQWVFERSNGG